MNTQKEKKLKHKWTFTYYWNTYQMERNCMDYWSRLYRFTSDWTMPVKTTAQFHYYSSTAMYRLRRPFLSPFSEDCHRVDGRLLECVAIYFRPGIYSFFRFTECDTDQRLEIIWIWQYSTEPFSFLAAIYHPPPHSPRYTDTELIEYLDRCVSSVARPGFYHNCRWL